MNWLLSGYVFLASPSSLRGTAHASVDEMRDERTMREPPHCLTPAKKQQPLPTGFALLLLPIVCTLLLLSISAHGSEGI